MIAAAYYRSMLTVNEQICYSVIVKGLLRHNSVIRVPQGGVSDERVRAVVQAIHLDHPELFFVDFWHYYLQRQNRGFTLRFRMLLEAGAAVAVSGTLRTRGMELKEKVPAEMSRKRQYALVAQTIAETTRYVDDHSAFWDHTAAGPVLRQSAVCEGIAKLFLYFCQQLNLPCAIVVGTYRGMPHAWNMIEENYGIRYIDVTALLQMPRSSCLFWPGLAEQTRENLLENGYAWDGSGDSQ